MRFNFIRELYRCDPKLIHHPYHFVSFEELSPIEKDMWGEIRCTGLPNIFMQYPILNYFVDFANPKLKYCIECDGKEFHLDAEKDLIRQAKIENEGWKMYRISGSACKKSAQNIFDEIYPNGYCFDGFCTNIIYEMDYENMIEFAVKFKYQSAELLIIYLKHKHSK